MKGFIQKKIGELLMKRKVAMLLTLFAATCMFSGCLSKADTKNTDISQSSATSDSRKVDWPFYEIQADNNTVGYLLGSIHVGKKEMYPFPKEITQAVAKSSAVASEVTFAALTSPLSATLAQKAIQEEPHVLTNLNEKDKERLNERLASYDYSADDLQGLNYFGLMTMLQAKYIDMSQVSFGVDLQLSKEAEKNDIFNIGFETVSEQYQLLNQATSGYLEQEDWIDAIPSLTEAKAENEKLLKFYIDGGIGDNFAELFEDSDFEGSTDIILDQRNLNWLAQLRGILPEQEQTFIVVGAGHLFGEKGLIQLLESEGYAVTKIAT